MVSSDHPLAVELHTLRTSLDRYKEESHTAWLKLQQETEGNEALRTKFVDLNEENVALRGELDALRAYLGSSQPPSLPTSHSYAALNAQSQSHIEHLALLTHSLTHTQSALAVSQQATANAYGLIEKLRNGEEEAKMRAREMEIMWRKEREERSVVELAVVEYASLVRNLTGRASTSSSRSSNSSHSSSNVSLDSKTSLSDGAGDGDGDGSGTHTVDAILQGRAGITKLFSEFTTEVTHLERQLTSITHERDTLQSSLDAERKGNEDAAEELARARMEVVRVRDDVERYMQFSQSTLLHNARLIDSLRSQLSLAQTREERIRHAFNNVTLDLARESAGRREEIRMRVASLARSPSGPHLSGSEHPGLCHAPPTHSANAHSSQSGEAGDEDDQEDAAARIVAAESAVQMLLDELERETGRRLVLERAVAFQSWEGGDDASSVDRGQDEGHRDPSESTSSSLDDGADGGQVDGQSVPECEGGDTPTRARSALPLEVADERLFPEPQPNGENVEETSGVPTGTDDIAPPTHSDLSSASSATPAPALPQDLLHPRLPSPEDTSNPVALDEEPALSPSPSPLLNIPTQALSAESPKTTLLLAEADPHLRPQVFSVAHSVSSPTPTLANLNNLPSPVDSNNDTPETSHADTVAVSLTPDLPPDTEDADGQHAGTSEPAERSADLNQIQTRLTALLSSFTSLNETIRSLVESVPESQTLLKIALQRIDDYNEDARVGLEIRIQNVSLYENDKSQFTGNHHQTCEERVKDEEHAARTFEKKLEDVRFDVGIVKHKLEELRAHSQDTHSATQHFSSTRTSRGQNTAANLRVDRLERSRSLADLRSRPANSRADSDTPSPVPFPPTTTSSSASASPSSTERRPSSPSWKVWLPRPSTPSFLDRDRIREEREREEAKEKERARTMTFGSVMTSPRPSVRARVDSHSNTNANASRGGVSSPVRGEMNLKDAGQVAKADGKDYERRGEGNGPEDGVAAMVPPPVVEEPFSAFGFRITMPVLPPIPAPVLAPDADAEARSPSNGLKPPTLQRSSSHSTPLNNPSSPSTSRASHHPPSSSGSLYTFPSHMNGSSPRLRTLSTLGLGIGPGSSRTASGVGRTGSGLARFPSFSIPRDSSLASGSSRPSSSTQHLPSGQPHVQRRAGRRARGADSASGGEESGVDTDFEVDSEFENEESESGSESGSGESTETEGE